MKYKMIRQASYGHEIVLSQMLSAHAHSLSVDSFSGRIFGIPFLTQWLVLFGDKSMYCFHGISGRLFPVRDE